jgi:hypothetical protein
MNIKRIFAPTVKAVKTMPDAPMVRLPIVGHEDHVIEKRFPHPSYPYQYSEVFDIQDNVLYDRIIFPAGSCLPMDVQFFVTNVGQICPYTGCVKSYRHTNMFNPGWLSPPTQFLAQRAIFAVGPKTLDSDVESISIEGYWEFWLLNKIMWSGPMLLHGPAKAKFKDVVKRVPKTKEDLAMINDLLLEEIVSTSYNSTYGTYIPSKAFFKLRLSFPDNRVWLATKEEGGKGLDLLIALQGKYARGVM